MSLSPTTNSVDWGTILLSADINVPQHRNEFNVLCPFHVDSRASCSINLEKGVWICHAGCGQGSLKKFLERKLGITSTEVEKFFDKASYSLDLDFFEEYEPTANYLEEVELPDDFIRGKYPKWIYRRGFSAAALDRWECGTNQYDDLIIPIRDTEERLVGWVSRRRAAVPKYMYSKGLKKSKVLFGAHRIKSPSFVCVTEGTLDAIWLDQQGYPAVALLGMYLARRQQELLSKVRTQEVVLCLDNDEAGKTGLDKALQSIGNTIMISYIELPSGYKDVQEIQSKEVLDNTINKRYYW